MLLRVPEVPRPSSSAVERAKFELDRALGGSKILTGADACATYANDDSDAGGVAPDMAVLAESAKDIAATLAVAQAHRVPVVPRAGGTGRTGGATCIAGGIVLAVQKLARIKDIDRRDLLAVVEPGVVTGALHEACEAEGLFYPPDPNSADSCMIGGNVAENAGGPRAFKYGVTREYVLGLEVALMGGRLLRTGKRTIKGVTGYDVTALLVGSEGTLGVFTEVTLRLVRKANEIATVLALFDDVHACAAGVARVIDSGIVPRCLELLDRATLDAVRAQGSAIDPRAGAMLLIEIDGDAVNASLERLGEALSSAKGIVDVVVAQDKAQRDRLWAARKMLSKATRKLAKHKLSEDIVVPRSKIPELLARADRICDKTRVQHLAYGHAGDGNLHVNFLWNEDDERERVEQSIEQLMYATVELGGTLSGEHGIGIAKQRYLPIEQSEEFIDLQRDIKRAFDPDDLLNPGKIFPRKSHAAC